MSRYIWDVRHDSYLMEKDIGGTTTVVYTGEPVQYGRLTSQYRAGTPSYYHFDGQGSTRALTDTSENVTDKATYTAFGEEVVSSGSTVNPFGYKGALEYYANGETDDVYVRARTYQPTLGRWVSRDPLAENGPHVYSRNETNQIAADWYTYAGNRPVDAIDPSGMLTILPLTARVPPKCEDNPVRYRWNFRRDAKPPPPLCHGWFVQRVDIWCELRKCPGCEAPPWPNERSPGEPTGTYWEAWEVYAGKRWWYGVLNHPKVHKYTDGFDVARPGGCGFLGMKGTLKFFCAKDKGMPDIRKTWSRSTTVFPCPQKPKFDMGTGPLWSTDDRNKAKFFEENRPQPVEGPEEHYLARRWQCCGCDELDVHVGSPKPKHL